MEESVSAINKMFEVIQVLRQVRFTGAERADYAGFQRLNVGVIRGGMARDYLESRTLQVPDFCTIRVAGRIAPSQTPSSALDDISATLRDRQKLDPDLHFEIEAPPAGVKALMPGVRDRQGTLLCPAPDCLSARRDRARSARRRRCSIQVLRHRCSASGSKSQHDGSRVRARRQIQHNA